MSKAVSHSHGSHPAQTLVICIGRAAQTMIQAPTHAQKESQADYIDPVDAHALLRSLMAFVMKRDGEGPCFFHLHHRSGSQRNRRKIMKQLRDLEVDETGPQ